LRACCVGASFVLNAGALILIAVLSEFYGLQSATARLMADLKSELAGYKTILVFRNETSSKPVVTQPKSAVRKRPLPPSPLATPNPRLLAQMDSRLVDFVKDNPAIESIITREMVRDLDSKVLDLDKLLTKSALRISFQIDESGDITRTRVEQSSRVPSIDHLAVELIRLLEKYKFLSGMKGLQRVLVSIQVEEDVEIQLEGEASDEAAAEEIRKQISNVLTLMRFALGEEAPSLLEGVRMEINASRVLVRKSFEKERLVDFLMQYYRAEPSKN
jgi:hypothetical protein